MANREMNFDLSKQPRLTPIIYGRVGDGDVQTVTVYLTLNDEPIDLTNYKIAFEGNTNGNATVIMDSSGIKNRDDKNGKFDYTFPNAANGVPGEYERAYFSIMNLETGNRSTTANFQILIAENADIDAEEAKSVISEYEQLVRDLNEAYQKAVDAYDDYYEQKIKEWNDRLSSLESKLTTLTNSTNSLDAHVKELKKAIEELSKFSVRYSDSIDFGDGDYSNNPDLVANLVNDPWHFSKAQINKNMIVTGNLPITTEEYKVGAWTIKDNIIVDKEYTISLKGTKKDTQTFRAFYTTEDGQTQNLLDMKKVPKLIDTWILTFKAPKNSKKDGTSVLSIYQIPQETKGSATIEWVKLEEGPIATPIKESPNTYRGISFHDSDNPNDYVWDYSMEYIDKMAQDLSNISGKAVMLTGDQKVDGVKNFIKQPQFNGKNLLTLDEVNGQILPVKNELQTHKNDRNNPHGVTAAQVGAIPIANTVKQTVTTPLNFTNDISHNGNLLLDESDEIIYRYRRSSMDETGLEAKATNSINFPECKVELFRRGNLVIANWRINVKDNTKFENSMPIIYRFPMGFQPFIDMAGTIYNAPLNIYQYAYHSTSLIQYAGIIELSGNDIRFASNKNGNHYVQGTFFTKDPFPSAGDLNGGTVVITQRNADGSINQS